MLLRLHFQQLDRVAHLHARQHLVALVVGCIVAAFLVDGDVARLDQRRAVGAQHVALRAVRARQDVDRDRVEQRVCHLTGHRAFPDQRVELELVGLKITLDVGRNDAGGGRTYRLVRFLRILGFGLVYPHLFRHRFRAIELRDHLANLLHRLGRERHRVGTHVGDQADAALARVHAFIQLLCHAHGALGGEAELARSFLLQRRGGERRRRVAAALLAIDLQHGERPVRSGRGRQALLGRARAGLVGEAELLDLVAAKFDQLEGKGLLAVLADGVDAPVLARLEGRDFRFALANHAQRGTLHPAGGQPAPHLLPQQRRQVEADQVVQRAPRLLRVHQVERQLARRGHRLAHGVAGDLVEHYAVHGLVLEVAALLENLGQVPGDGLTLTVRVGRKVQ